MKKIFFPLLSTAFAIVIFTTCQKTDQPRPDRPPVAKAGADATIILPTDSIILDGSHSSYPDDSISNYQWIKISGPDSFNIVNASAAQTKVKNLVWGIYLFQLQVTGSNGISAKDTVKITVRDPGPIANAGANVSISLSSCTDKTGFAELDGTGSSDPNNNIVSYSWVPIYGPSGYKIISPSSAKTRVENISQGEYAFELLVTDAGGMVSKDTMLISAKGNPKEYDVDIVFNSTFAFIDNYYDCLPYSPYCYYYDWTIIEGKGNFLPFGEFNIYVNEDADTAALSDQHNTVINFGDGNGNHVNGNCSINFKKLIVQGGGPFNGTYAVTDGSAVACDRNIFTSLAPLTVTGSLDLATHTTTIRIKGKLYF